MIAFFIILLLVLMIILFIRLNDLSRKVERLDREIIRIREIVQPGNVETSSASEPDIREKAARDKKPAPEPATKTVKPAVAKKASKTREEWESLIGGKLLNRIGALALIIAVGFFLKYAFDNNWINETIRVVIGGLTGCGLMVLAFRFKTKGLNIFAQGLVGAGISILYLSVYAAYNFYFLISQPAAVFVMTVVTIIGFLQALGYNAAGVSLLALAGGLLTPVLLSSDHPNEVGLFIYLILLNLGIILIVSRKDTWWFLEPLALISSYTLFAQWSQGYFDATKLNAVIVFLTILWGIYFIFDIIRIVKNLKTFFEFRRSIAAANGIIYFSLLYLSVDRYAHAWMGLTALLVALIYMIAFLLIRSRVPDDTKVHIQYAISAIILLIAATTIQFSGFITLIFWLIEAGILFWIGSHTRINYLWWSGIALFCLTLLRLIGTPSAWQFEPLGDFDLVVNLRTLTFIVLWSITGFGLFFCKKLQTKYLQQIRTILLYSLSVSVLWLLTVEVLDYFRQQMAVLPEDLQGNDIARQFMILAAVWLGHALIFILSGLQFNLRPFIYTGIFSMIIATVEALMRSIIQYIPLVDFTPILNYRSIVILAVLFGLFLTIYRLESAKEKYSWIRQLQTALQITIIVLCFTYITGEVKDYFDKILLSLGPDDLSRNQQDRSLMTNLKQLSLSGIWLGYSIFLMVLGILRRNYLVRIASMVIFGLTILKIFIYDLSFLETFYRIFSFFGLGMILLLVSYLYNRYREVILGSRTA